MNNKSIIGTIIVSALITLSGCSPEDISDAVDGASHDKVTVVIVNNDQLKVQWEKNYNGYSEVLSRKTGVTKRTGYFLTANSTGNYEIVCSINSYSPVTFSCQDTGSGYVSNPRFPDMEEDTIYNIQVSEGTEHNYQDITTSIIYNTTSNSLELR